MQKNILGNLHVIINIVLLSICVLFCMIFTFAVDIDIAKNFRLAFFVSIAILLVFNILMISLVIFQRKKINETLQALFVQEDYSNAREYLDKCRSKIVMPAVYQILLYYSGYVELLDNDIEKGKQFLKQYKIDKQYRMNSLFVIFCLFLLYFIYLYEEDECGLVAIREKYNKYKTSLSKTISSNEEAKLAIETIDYFENNLIKEGVKHLRVSRFYKLLFLNRLVDRYK